MTRPQGLALLAAGASATPLPAALARNEPSFYADPVAWLVVDAVGRALRTCPEDIVATPQEVGVVMISETCTLATMHAVAAGTARGRISPLRFAGAGPGTITGLPCLTWGFRGPSLTFTSPPHATLPVAVTVVRGWLHRGMAAHVVLGAHHIDRTGEHIAASAIVRMAVGERTVTLDDLSAALRIPTPTAS